MKIRDRFLPHPVLSIVLTIVWLLLNNDLSGGHIVLGLFLGITIPFLTQSFFPEKFCLKNPSVLAKFVITVLYDIVVANVVVAKLILGDNDKLKPGFLIIDLDIKHPLGISTLANTISLTPGTVSCDLSRDRTQLIVHALHVEDIDTTIKEIKDRYEKPLMEVFVIC